MKYFVFTDIHGFYDLFMQQLKGNGFDVNNPNHKIIICGDLMDRGKQAVAVQEAVLQLLNDGKVILIRGNHEDLMMDMLENWFDYEEQIRSGFCHHISNGTFDTALQLTGYSKKQALKAPNGFLTKLKNTSFVQTIIPACRDYFETEHYVFVHGYLPCLTEPMPFPYIRSVSYKYNSAWRTASKEEWGQSRWINGMDAAVRFGVIEPNKTVVCGHYHASYGHWAFGNETAEFDAGAKYAPFYANGIIAMDACTARSGQMNCVVLDD